MKKFLAIIAIALVACMLMVTPAFAEDERTPDYMRDYDQDVFYAKKFEKAPRIDGTINADEWGEPIVIKTTPNYWQSLRTDDTYAGYTADDPGELADRALKELKVWFGYDDAKIYIAYEQLGGAWDTNTDSDNIAGNNYDEYTFRHNNVMRLGFDIEDVSNLMQLDYSAPWTLNANGAGTFADTAIKFTAGMPYAAADSCITYTKRTPIAGAMIKRVYADDGAPMPNLNSQDGQYIEYLELAFDKARLLKAVNESCNTDYAELPNAMFFSLYFRHYSWGDTGFSKVVYNGQTAWFGTPLDLDQQLDIDNLFTYFPDVVVFGDKIETPVHEGDLTEAPTTEAPTEAPTTEAPATDAPSDTAEQTEAPTEEVTEPAAEGGCGGMISLSGMAIVAAAGAMAIVSKKKKR